MQHTLTNLQQMLDEHRRKEMQAVFKFIYGCDTEEIAEIIAEIRCYHDNLIVWNPATKSLEPIDSVSINGESIQLNIGAENAEEKEKCPSCGSRDVQDLVK